MPAWLNSRSARILVTAAAAAVLLSARANAAPVTYHVAGTVTSTAFPDYHVLPGVAAGSSISGSITYNPVGDTVQGPPSEFDLYVGQLRFRSGPAGVRITAGKESGPAGPHFSLQSAGAGSTVASDPRLQDVFTLMELQNGVGTLGISGLSGPPAPGTFAERFGIGATLALASSDLAPEPGSLLLMLPGLAGLALLRYRRPAR
ncbi:MAG: hypothetical protein K0Q72_1985 [Armatimonadetes bacterium]|nr:hypothetical protein [Armatimonadota bacterium]